MFRGKQDDEENVFQPALNPNQRQFIEDEKRYKEKLKLLHGGTLIGANLGFRARNFENIQYF